MSLKLGDFKIKTKDIKNRPFSDLISLEGVKDKKMIFDLLNTIDFSVIGSGKWNLITRKINKSFMNVENFRGYISRYIAFEEENTEFYAIGIDNICQTIIVKNSKNFIAIINDFYDAKSYYLDMFNNYFDINMDGVTLQPENMEKEKEKEKVKKKEDEKLSNEIIKKSKKDMEVPKSSSKNVNQLDSIMKNFKKSGEVKYKKQDVETKPDNKKVNKTKSKKSNEKNKIMKPKKTDSSNSKKVNIDKIPNGTRKTKNDKKQKVKIPQIKGINSKAKDYTPKKKVQKENKKTQDNQELLYEKYVNSMEQVKLLTENVSNWELSLTLSDLGYEPSDDRDENIVQLKKAMEKHGKNHVKNILYRHII